MSDSGAYDSTGGVAIIGMSCRFPGAKNIAQFWQNLREGIESITRFSDQELEEAGVDPDILSDPNYVKAGGILDDVELFDAAFFGFNPREAEILDPQQRVFLECAWEAFENAGYDPQSCPGAVGVYAGVSISSYLDNIYSNPEIVELLGDYQILLGNDKDQLPTYVSYKFDLKGPSMAIQTACSTSLVAICMACQSLLDYQCDMVLAGGSSIAVPQKTGYLYQEGMIVSPDGHCRAFDSQAQGTVGGNGVGVVLLKRLDDAVAHGDHIYAVIKGWALNNDGSLKVGYTAPSIEGQAEVIAMAHALAGIDPETISYVEAHGTGTPLGDPIEIRALTEAFRAQTDKKNFCAVGSVKTNIGHLDSAAGVAGLIKTALALKHRMIPPSLHFKQPNPKIDFANSPFYVNDRLKEWRTGATPRLAGVSSFGIGGTNAHAILEETPAMRPSPETTRPYKLLLISARTPSALEKATSNLAEHLRANPDLNLADVAYTLQVGRKPFNHRRMLVCRDLDDAAGALERLDPKRVLTSAPQPRERPVVFMFSGQGTQYVNMGRELYETEPFFREQVDICSELLKPHLGLDLRSDVLYPSAGESEQESAQRLEQTALTQPALFVIEYALARLWMEWGVRPQAMIGHSIGEYVAACLSGVFSLEDALQLVAARGRLMQQAASGAMLAVPLSEKDVEPLLGEKLSLAAVNGPSSCVVSGLAESISELEAHLNEKGLACRRLHTSHAFHSALMEPLLIPFTEQVKGVKISPPGLPYVSNVTGNWITAAEATDPVYWARHLRQTVRFADGLERLLKESDSVLLEVGPGQTLSALARQHPAKASEQVVLNSLRHPQERQPDVAFLLTTLGRLWLAGVRVDWKKFHEDVRRRLPLPTYPFDRQRYWIEAQERVESAATRASDLPLRKNPDISDWFYIPSWKRSVLPELFQQSDLSAQKSRWLLFSDECGVGAGLTQRLEDAGQDVFIVMPGEQFAKRSEKTYIVNPREPQDYDALLRELNALGWIPEVIVHLWSVTPDDEAQRGIESFEKFQALGFYSLLFLAQALGVRLNADQLQLAVVSNQMQAVTGEETLCPSKATVLGPCKVIPEEYTQIICRSIDIALPDSGLRQGSRLIEQLIAELVADTSDPVVAYRGKHRWVQTFEAVPLDEREEKNIRLREKGVYLITGGLGGIGLTLAEHLAATAQARLALLGRSAFPERGEWARWLATHDEADDVSRKIRKFQTLEEMGAEIMIASADVADHEAMRGVVKRVTERFGSITGVIHSAGVAGGRIIQLQTMEESQRVMAPKVQGTLALDAIFEDAELDFFVLCSSLNAIQGAAGQVDYCGANAFLDAFAHHASSRNGGQVVSVNWDAWQEVGMAVNTIVPRDMEEERAESLKQGILPAEGVEALTRILSTTLPQVAVSTLDLPALLELESDETSESEDEEIEQPISVKTLHERPALSSDYIAPRSEVERILASTWQKLLGVEQVGVYDNFFELGGHSLLAVQLISRLRESFQVELTVRDLFDSPTAAEIAERIESSRRSVEEDTDEIDQTLRLVEQLSEDQLRELLTRQGDAI